MTPEDYAESLFAIEREDAPARTTFLVTAPFMDAQPCGSERMARELRTRLAAPIAALVADAMAHAARDAIGALTGSAARRSADQSGGTVSPQARAESLYRIEPVDPDTLEATGQMREMMLKGVVLRTPGGLVEWHETEASARAEREACVAGLAAAIEAAERDARTTQATELAEALERRAEMLREQSARDAVTG